MRAAKASAGIALWAFVVGTPSYLLYAHPDIPGGRVTKAAFQASFEVRLMCTVVRGATENPCSLGALQLHESWR
jgi:hypothetical protein